MADVYWLTDYAMDVIDQDTWPTPDFAVRRLMTRSGCLWAEAVEVCQELHRAGRIVSVTVDGFQFFTTPERQAGAVGDHSHG